MSGSAVSLPGIGPFLMYTGHTAATGDTDQSQNIAFPSDPSDDYLVNWHKVTTIIIISQMFIQTFSIVEVISRLQFDGNPLLKMPSDTPANCSFYTNMDDVCAFRDPQARTQAQHLYTPRKRTTNAIITKEKKITLS